MGNIAALPIAALGQVVADTTIFTVIGSDPDQIRDEFMAKYAEAAGDTLAINDLSIGGSGQGAKFCVTATLVPNPGGEPIALRFYMASSPEELANAFNEAYALLIEDVGQSTYDFLGNTVVGSSDGKRFFGCVLARRQAM